MATVWLAANTISYPEGGGHQWAYLNWALGLRANDCEVVWLERVPPAWTADDLAAHVELLKARLRPYGLDGAIALHRDGQPVRPPSAALIDLDQASEADLLLDINYSRDAALVERFRTSALLDIDPGLMQIWFSAGQMVRPAPHDLYFTIGETVGQPGARFPDCGFEWIYTPPCVSLEHWRPTPPAVGPYTTVSHWYAEHEWVVYGDESYDNSKRAGFLDYLDLPRQTPTPLELALRLDGDEPERQDLERRGWSVREAASVSSTPWDYQAYVQSSRGEFSCVKPSCVRLQNAWISDRSLCYLASGKPVVVQHTGPSRILPDAEGLLRFRTPDEAVLRLAQAEADYERHAAAARRLAEEVFDAKKVAKAVLERCL